MLWYLTSLFSSYYFISDDVDFPYMCISPLFLFSVTLKTYQYFPFLLPGIVLIKLLLWKKISIFFVSFISFYNLFPRVLKKSCPRPLNLILNSHSHFLSWPAWHYLSDIPRIAPCWDRNPCAHLNLNLSWQLQFFHIWSTYLPII